MGVLSLPPTHPQPRIAFFLLKRVVKVVVWLLATCERWGSSLADESAFHEPKYVWFAMRCVVGDATRSVILGDMFEDYRRIHGERGEVDADDWLRNELVETLLALIWRPAFVSHCLTSIRRLASFDFLRRTASLFGSKAGNSFAMSNAFLCQPTIRVAFAMLLMLSVPILIFYGNSRLITQVKDYQEKSATSEQIAKNVQPPTSSLPTLDIPADARRKSMETSLLKSKQNIHRSTKTTVAEITLTSDDFTRTGDVTRSVADMKVTTIPRHRTPPLSLKLPDRSESSLYDITLRDAAGKDVFSSTAKSVDGKIRVEPSLQKFLQKLPDSDYHFSLSDRSNKNGSPINFRFVLSRK